jgi:hypothetical protein
MVDAVDKFIWDADSTRTKFHGDEQIIFVWTKGISSLKGLLMIMAEV